MNPLLRNNVNITGNGEVVIMFAHGFGCDQNMWRFVAPRFEDQYTVVLFDHVGSGNSDLQAYDPEKYRSLTGYADDIVEIIRALDRGKVIFVGHSVSALMGIMAAVKSPGLFEKLVLVGPSPSYINDGDYVGGFDRGEIDEMLAALDNNHLGWSMSMAPVIMGNPDRPELGEELAGSFCRAEPSIARQFARTTFLSDGRQYLSQCPVPSLVLQCSSDVIAPVEVGEYVHRHLPDSRFVMLDAVGHCPNLSAPEETTAAIKQFLN
ncbi:MAG: alpha/beta hydrolase [Chitinophagaceae bacterium]|nr:MAG: alpha/beta hydrolase [Chitinophagaceae bacterium]